MSRPGSKPTVVIDESKGATRVRVTVGTAEVWLRATTGGRRLQVSIEEGDGDVIVDWSIRVADDSRPPVVNLPFVQSPYRDRWGLMG